MDQVGTVDGEHLADLGNILVYRVQCQEEVDDACVRDDVQLGPADGHFLTVAIIPVVPDPALDLHGPEHRIIVLVMVRAGTPHGRYSGSHRSDTPGPGPTRNSFNGSSLRLWLDAAASPHATRRQFQQ